MFTVNEKLATKILNMYTDFMHAVNFDLKSEFDARRLGFLVGAATFLPMIVTMQFWPEHLFPIGIYLSTISLLISNKISERIIRRKHAANLI